MVKDDIIATDEIVKVDITKKDLDSKKCTCSQSTGRDIFCKLHGDRDKI